jgi:hypothetical protein
MYLLGVTVPNHHQPRICTLQDNRKFSRTLGACQLASPICPMYQSWFSLKVLEAKGWRLCCGRISYKPHLRSQDTVKGSRLDSPDEKISSSSIHITMVTGLELLGAGAACVGLLDVIIRAFRSIRDWFKRQLREIYDTDRVILNEVRAYFKKYKCTFRFVVLHSPSM